PRVRGWNWVIWAGPFVLLLIGGLVLTRTLSRWSASAASTPPDPLPPLSEPSRKRIDSELRAYDQ
ncbi:MAG TPA: cytochrome c-type biogenesis protein CcmH, partial [Nitrospiria bacterium]|nr:cytochrome c-type biogenesis protein CcmH [Nitrospiria bacterium]